MPAATRRCVALHAFGRPGWRRSGRRHIPTDVGGSEREVDQRDVAGLARTHDPHRVDDPGRHGGLVGPTKQGPTQAHVTADPEDGSDVTDDAELAVGVADDDEPTVSDLEQVDNDHARDAGLQLDAEPLVQGRHVQVVLLDQLVRFTILRYGSPFLLWGVDRRYFITKLQKMQYISS